MDIDEIKKGRRWRNRVIRRDVETGWEVYVGKDKKRWQKKREGEATGSGGVYC